MGSEKNVPRCSFCGKTQDQVEKLILGRNANICDECVVMCSDVVTENRTDRFLYAADRSEAGIDFYNAWVAPAEREAQVMLTWLPGLPATPQETMGAVEEVRSRAGLVLDLVNLDKRTVHLLSCARLMAQKPCVALVRDAENFPLQMPWLRLVEVDPDAGDTDARHATVTAALRSLAAGEIPTPSEDFSDPLRAWNDLFAMVDKKRGAEDLAATARQLSDADGPGDERPASTEDSPK